MDEHNKEIKDALEFYNKVQYFFEEGVKKFPQDIKVGSFGVDKGDDVEEQYGLMLDYFQEEGMNLDNEDHERGY